MSPAKKVAKKAAKKAATKVAKKTTKKTTKATKTSVRKAAPSPRKSVAPAKKSATRGAKKTAGPARKRPAAQTPGTLDAALLASRAAAKAERRSRAAQRMAHVAERMGQTDLGALAEAMAALRAREEAEAAAVTPPPPPPPKARSRARGARAAAPRAFPTADANRWVPIGPSVVRRGQADGRPRVAGRIRDIAVDPTGRRAYAASGKAGVWYTEDAGNSWRPVGGWQSRAASVGGISTDMSCGCLLVTFGATAADDYVMVGTGELALDTVFNPTIISNLFPGGRGVLSGRGPATATPTQVTFELASGIAQLENAAIYRLARDPARTTAAQIAVTGDRVLAATTLGLFLGTCTTIGGQPTWAWAKLPGLDPMRVIPPSAFQRKLTDVQWIAVPGLANGRILVAIDSLGVCYSDNLGAPGSWTWMPGFNRLLNGDWLSTNIVLSAPVNGRMYVLSGQMLAAPINGRNNNAQLHRIPNVARAAASGGPGAAVLVAGTPADLWGTQIHWDQALFAERVGANDRVWLGGSFVRSPEGDFSAAVYSFDVNDAAVGGPALQAVPQISDVAGAGADFAGWVGKSLHADVHAIAVFTLPTGQRHVWVSCDGGVYVSEMGGRVNSFQARVTGLAVLEATYVAQHPTSSHYCAIGSQDNGTQARVGDMLWELINLGDGGGVMFHPTQSHYIVNQYIRGTWRAVPEAGFHGPLSRAIGGAPANNDREAGQCQFYSGGDAIAWTGGRSRMAVGTERVWISDDIGVASPNTWNVIPSNTVAATASMDPRPGGVDVPANQAFGVDQTVGLGPVTQLRWESPTRLYAVYRNGIVRHDQVAGGLWTTTIVLQPMQANAPDTNTVVVTDLAPIPGGTDFYFTTLGDSATVKANATDTCWLFIGGNFVATNLRHKLGELFPPGSLGPLDPAHAVCLDPDDDRIVYVGTIGGIFRGVRNALNAHAWTTYMNGMPSTCVSDLKVWRDPVAPAPGGTRLKLLRAATQSRGVWEVDMVNPTPPDTYLRVHLRDDRRRLPTPLADPRRSPNRNTVVYASPDIVIRPAPRTAASALVPFPLPAADTITVLSNNSYRLWTFQTAFRWRYPAIRADGQWSDQLADLIAHFRSVTPGLTAGNVIDRATWNAVVQDTRLDANRNVTAPASGDRCAVYETPWQLSGTTPGIATEVDIHELVLPLRKAGDIWRVYREPAMVDVLLHHRGTAPRAANAAYTAVFYRAAATVELLLATPASRFTALHAWNGDAAVPTPTGFTRVEVGGNAVHRLNAALDVFMPKAVSVPLDLSTVGEGQYVMIVAICGSDAQSEPVPTGLAAGATMSALVRAWPRCAIRIIQATGRRPVP